ncbi:MAG: transporter ATP-binding protein [Herbinix sp.]|nr:transporter ATP-binding protein [Herbinix sp.]
MELLEVKGLTKRYKGFLLDDISFSLPKGYIMGYVGQNGAGKTTTINCINQICHANSGTIYLNGRMYKEDPIQYKEEIGFIGDESYFPKEMRISDIRSIQKTFYRSFQEAEFDQLIARFKLPEKKKISEFSRGMKVKLMFAAALSRDTKLLILDEATNGLDPVIRSEVLQILQDYISDGERSILFSTHMLEDLEQIADYIVFIDQGKIIISETKDDLLESYILIKGDYKELTTELRSRLIGLEKKEFGFEALIKSDEARNVPKGFVINKPSIDKIMVHLIRNSLEGV